METKKKYHKPQLREVKLIAEEAVLTYCRTTGGITGANRTCASNTRCTRATSATGGS